MTADTEMANAADTLCLDQLMVMRGDVRLCGPLQLSACAGQVWHVIGPNGTGKTTLLMMLAGILPIVHGQVRWQDRLPSEWSVLYLGHLAGLNASLTVIDNLRFLAALGRLVVPSDQVLWHALAMTGLAGYEDVLVSRLSSGQKRRVNLARLWLPDAARLWLLDEPMTALDHQMIGRLNQRLREHAADGGMVLLTSHQPVDAMTDVLDLADYRCGDGLEAVQ